MLLRLRLLLLLLLLLLLGLGLEVELCLWSVVHFGGKDDEDDNVGVIGK